MFNRLLLTLVFFVLSHNCFALRVSQPPSLSVPVEEDQTSSLNKYLKDIWDIQNGRFEMDIVTDTKTNAKNGEFWIFNNVGMGSYNVQFKAGDAVRTITSGGGSGTSPGGSPTQIQYNNSGTFAGVSSSGVDSNAPGGLYVYNA